MGVNGANTTVQFGGGSGGGGSGNGGDSSPAPRGGWNDAPPNLKAEVMASSFNTMAAPDGGEEWRQHASKVVSMTETKNIGDIVQAFAHNDDSNSRTLWMDYGKKLDEPKIVGGDEVTYSSGAIHIYERHAEDFENCGIGKTHILRTVREIATNGYLVEQGTTARGGYELREWNGRNWRLAIGSNGFIVSAYPD